MLKTVTWLLVAMISIAALSWAIYSAFASIFDRTESDTLHAILLQLVSDTPFGFAGIALATTVLLIALVLSVGSVIIIVAAVTAKKDSKSKLLGAAMQSCIEAVLCKFKKLRTTAIIFGAMLTIIILSLMHSDLFSDGPENIPDPFWIAFGVVLSAFATAITKLVEGKDDD